MVPDINLIPKLDRKQSSSKLVLFLLGIVILLGVAMFLWQFLSLRGEVETLEKNEANLISERDSLQQQFTQNQTEKQETTIEDSLQFVDMISYPVTPLIGEIEGLQPEHSYLRSYSFSTDSVSISIDFETLSDIATYISRLSNSDYFTDSQISSITNFDLGNEEDEEKDFTIVPRQSVQISLLINERYLATGGGR